MAYLQQTSWKDRPGAVAGVIAIHAIVGYALVNGLTLSAIVDAPTRLKSEFVPDIPLDPPPPPKTEEVKQDLVPQNPAVAPLPKLDLAPSPPILDTIPTPLPVPVPLQVTPMPIPTQDAGPRRPAFDPVAAKPRNNPTQWVTDNDYRSSWINREMTGTARFRLDIAASGRVENCTITGSSGHPDLDRATCDLISRRARFDPAKNGDGEKIGGTFSSAVKWELPR